jgi:hypothetical protein
MTTFTKLEAVLWTLKNQDFLSWYKEQHGLDVSELNEQSIRVYGTTGFGDIADLILTDGLDHVLIKYDYETGIYFN